MKKAFLFLIIFICTSIVVGLWARLLHYSNIVVISLTSNIILLAIFTGFKFIRFSTEYIKTNPWKDIMLCAIAAVSMLVPSVFLQESMPELPNSMENELMSMMQSPLGYIAVALMAPIVEEIVFRGAILNALLKWDKLQGKHWWAIIISACLFALVHFNPAQTPHALLMGVLLGWIVYRTGSILPTIMMHVINNSIAFITSQFYSDPNVKLIDIFGSQQTIGIVVVVSLIILIGTIFALNKYLVK